MSFLPLLRPWLERRLDPPALAWFREALREVSGGPAAARFGALVSLASRHVEARPLEPTAEELAAAEHVLPGWRPERWELREGVRVALVLAHPELAREAGERAVDELFRYADEGELRALCRSLALLPAPERFLARARAGCRSNMRSVFEAAALDTPFPFRFFDDLAWNQAVVKCLFVEAPLWRLVGLDRRLSGELARMALDLADERRSAGRTVRHELWLCLGAHSGERGLRSLELELDPSNPHRLGRRAAAIGLARAGAVQRLAARRETEEDRLVRQAMDDALQGRTSAETFQQFD